MHGGSESILKLDKPKARAPAWGSVVWGETLTDIEIQEHFGRNRKTVSVFFALSEVN